MRVHGNMEVLPEPGRPDEGLGGGASAAASNGALGDHESALVLAVDVPVLVSHLLPGLDEGRGQGRVPGRLLDSQVAPLRVVGRPRQVRILIILGLLEVAQHLGRAPAVVALLLPHVVVTLITAQVQHVVKDTRAAEDFAPRPVAPAVLHRWTEKFNGFLSLILSFIIFFSSRPIAFFSRVSDRTVLPGIVLGSFGDYLGVITIPRSRCFSDDGRGSFAISFLCVGRVMAITKPLIPYIRFAFLYKCAAFEIFIFEAQKNKCSSPGFI
jgi:hypothetical protein